MELKVTPWSQPIPPTEEELQTSLAKQDLKVYRWSNQPEEIYGGHTHGYHKVLYVVEGSIKIDCPTHHKIFTLNPGDRLDLPAGTRHSAIVGPQGVICLEAHIY
jgi:mannose-6-phosphate isomerase-like protein (cupin superfamily)